MGFNDSLKCPGLDRTLSITPMEVHCPQCDELVEIWSDESNRRCTNCGMMVCNPEPMVAMPEREATDPSPSTLQDSLDEMIELSISLGSSTSTIIDADEVLVENHLADICRENSCPNFGLSPTCPPHVEGPEWLRQRLKEASHTMIVEIEAPPEVIYSENSKEIGKLLHFIVIELEKFAHEKGLLKSKAFAGGSCKNLYCSDYASCNVLYGDGVCRNPGLTRPSVSGYGINMNHLIKIARRSRKEDNTANATSSRYGIVLIG